MGIGFSFQANVDSAYQNVNTKIFNEANSACTAKCENISSNNTIIVNDSVVGSISIDQSCTVEATCTMQNTLDTQISTILAAVANQSNNFSDPFLAIKAEIGVNDVTLSQVINNQITQIIQSSCGAVSNNISNGNFYALNNSKVEQIGWNQQGNAQSSCVMNNISKIVVYNQAQATADQTNKDESLLSTLLLIAGIAVILIFGLSIFKGVSNKNKPEAAKGTTPATSAALTSALTSSSTSSSLNSTAASAIAKELI